MSTNEPLVGGQAIRVAVLDRWPTFRDLLLEDCEESSSHWERRRASGARWGRQDS